MDARRVRGLGATPRARGRAVIQRVVTLPAGLAPEEAAAFASRARSRGAALLELRTDWHASPESVADRLPSCALLAAERGGRPIPEVWRSVASIVDVPIESSSDGNLRSHHATRPLRTAEALAVWSQARLGDAVQIKHVEPLGEPSDGWRLLETQRLLGQRFGSRRVTVLCTGDCALPFRAVLAQRNALDYLALDAGSMSARGQRLIADAIRADAAPYV